MLAADRSRKFEEVLAAYLEAKERGEPTDRAALLRAHPEIAGELREFFDNERKLASVAAGLPGKTAVVRTSGARVGEYEILSEIARGGMGVVYRARHVRLHRIVALKMMLGGEFEGSEGVRRFRNETEVVASLDHPNIVPIHDVGEHNGQAFYAMKLIDGPSLKQQVAAYVGKPDEAARIISVVARAVHHAHQHGILHRDLKPGNILLAPQESRKLFGELKKDDYPVAGIPHGARFNPKTAAPFVADFGLAKRTGSDGLVSHSTGVVGTAAYMAPEQAKGKQALSVAADVYSLGAVLFELLTGRTPFVGDNQMEVLLQAVDTEAPSPVRFQPTLDPDLAQVCLKCLRKDPEERYESAEALAEELEHWQEGEPLAVRAPTFGERLVRWLRRHPVACFMLLLTASLIAGSVVVNWHLSDLNRQLTDANQLAEGNKRLAEKKAETEVSLRTEADAARAVAEKTKAVLQATLAMEKAAREAEKQALDKSRLLLVQQFVANGQQMMQRGDTPAAAVWFAAALEQDQGEPARELPHRIRLGATLRQLPALKQMWFLDAAPRFVRLSPAGDRLLTVRKDTGATLWDTRTGQRIGGELAAEAVGAAEFSPDGRHVAVATAAGGVQLWSAADGAPYGKPFKQALPIHAFAFSSDSMSLATACADKAVRIWDADGGSPIGKALKHDQDVRLVAFHPSGKKLLTFSEDAKLRVWDLSAGGDVLLPGLASGGMLACGFSQNGQRIYAVSSGRKLHLWQLSGKSLATPAILSVKGDLVHWLSPNADRLVLPSENDVKVLDVPKGSVAFTLNHDSPVYLGQFSPGGRFIVTATANRGVQVWHAGSGQPVGHAVPQPQTIADVCFSRDDRWLATVGVDRCIRLWDISAIERNMTSVALQTKGLRVSLSPDGSAALLSQAKSTVLQDLARSRKIGVIPLASPLVHCAWAGDSRTLAIATRDEARVYDARTGMALAPALKLDKSEEAGMHLYYASSTGPIALWNATQARAWDATGKLLWQRKLTKQTHVLDCDGRRLALWRNQGTLEVQDVGSDKTRPLLKLAIVPALFQFSPDGRLGVAGFGDGSLRIWDLTTGKPATLPFWHGAPVRRVTWSPDARFLASADSDNRVRVWDVASGQPLTPPLASTGTHLAFSADSLTLTTWSDDGAVQRFRLTPQAGDASALVRAAQLIAGQELHDANGNLTPIDISRQQLLWRESLAP